MNVVSHTETLSRQQSPHLEWGRLTRSTAVHKSNTVRGTDWSFIPHEKDLRQMFPQQSPQWQHIQQSCYCVHTFYVYSLKKNKVKHRSLHHDQPHFAAT